MIGFTLIELMIVLAIVGILAAIAIPTYYNYVAKAQFAEAMSLASGVKTAVADAYQGRDSLVGLNNGTGSIPAASDISGTYVSHVEVNNGVITSYFSDDSALAGKVAILQPEAANGALTWNCHTSVSAARSPSQCESVAVIVPKKP